MFKHQTYFHAYLGIVVNDHNPGQAITQGDDILYEVVKTDTETAYECAKTGTRGTLPILAMTYPRTNFHFTKPLQARGYRTGEDIPLKTTMSGQATAPNRTNTHTQRGTKCL